MRFIQDSAVAVWYACCALSVGACDRSETPQASDAESSLPAVTADSEEIEVSGEEFPSTWETSAGPVFVVRGNQPTEAHVVYPSYSDSTLPDTVRLDAATIRNTKLEIFARSGKVGEVHVSRAGAEVWTGPGCIDWPAATVDPEIAGATVPSWTVAFLKGHVQPLPLDSIEGLSRADSARLAAEATRLASTLPSDTAVSFRGIPFSVRAVYRFRAAPGVEGLAADVVRRVNQEANPLEEHILLVAERDSVDTRGRYRAVYSERASGTEEGVETTEILAAVVLRSPVRAALVLARSGFESAAYALLERGTGGRWQVRWTSVHTGC